MEIRKDQAHSHLFTLRMWLEELGEDRREWRGQVEHVLSGERQFFRDWPTLVAFLVKATAQLSDGRFSIVVGTVESDQEMGAAP